MKDTFRAKFQIFNLTSPIALLKKNVYLLIYIYKNELLPEQYIYIYIYIYIYMYMYIYYIYILYIYIYIYTYTYTYIYIYMYIYILCIAGVLVRNRIK